MARKSRWAEKVEICTGIDMYLIERRGYMLQIRRYKWDTKRKIHVIGEIIPIKNNSLFETLWNLRMDAFMKHKKEANHGTMETDLSEQ